MATATKSNPVPISALQTPAEPRAEGDKPPLKMATTDLRPSSETIGRFVTATARTALFPLVLSGLQDEAKERANSGLV